MISINIRNEVYLAVEEFNRVSSKPEHKADSNEERTGLFYTILRRKFAFGSRRKNLTTNNLNCKFNPDGTMKCFHVNGLFEYGWSLDLEPLRQLKELSIEKPEFFSTPIMNEIADIVNSIK